MKPIAFAAFALLLSSFAQANGMLQWQNNSLSYLYGQHYRVTPEIQQTLTFEHASNWTVGDLFLFVDYSRYNGQASANGKNSYYGEFSPRFSLSKTTEKDLSFGVIKDVLIAGTYEFGEGNAESYLLGAGVDLALAPFDFFKLNLYHRFPEQGDGKTFQLTPVWKMTFPVGQSRIVFDGFIDWVINSDGEYRSNLHINPQIKYDLSDSIGLKPQSLLAGVELDYWKNKFGIQDSSGFNTDQKAVSLMVKYHF